jgi:hypothetical protein
MITLLLSCNLVPTAQNTLRTHFVHGPIHFTPSSPRPSRDTIGDARVVALGWDPLLYRDQGVLRSDVLEWTVDPRGTTLVLRGGLGPRGVESFSSADVCHSVSAPCTELDALRALVEAPPEELVGVPLYRGDDYVYQHTTSAWLLRAQPNRGAVASRGNTRISLMEIGDMEVVLRAMERDETSILDVVRPSDQTRIQEDLPHFDLELEDAWSWLVLSGPQVKRAALRERFPPRALAEVCFGTASGPHVVVDSTPGGDAAPEALVLSVSDPASVRCQSLRTAIPQQVTLGHGDLELRLVTVMGAEPAPPAGDVWAGVRHISVFVPGFPPDVRERFRRAVLTSPASSP